MPSEYNSCPANVAQKNPIMEAQLPTIATAPLTSATTSTAHPTPTLGIAVAVTATAASGGEGSMIPEVQTMLTRTEDVPAPLPLPTQTMNPSANGNGNIDSNANTDLNDGGNNANENDTSVATTNNNNQSSNNGNQKVIKARKSFSLKEKVSYVMAFQEDCHSGKPEEKVEEELKLVPPSETAEAETADGTKESTTSSAKKSKTRKKKAKAKAKPQPTASMHGFKTKKLKSWLKSKNEKDGTSIAYPTMYKWVQKYAQESEIPGGMENSSSSHSKKRNSSALQEEWQSSIGHLKKIRSRPFQELESVLVEFLRVRNDSLRKKGMPVSAIAFIKDRANMFYKDMYNVEGEHDAQTGNEAENLVHGHGNEIAVKATFKCSTGEYTYVCRLLECV